MAVLKWVGQTKDPFFITANTDKQGKVVLVGSDPATGYPAVWIETRTGLRNQTREFHVIGTGHEIPENCTHVGSFIAAPFVWHVYEQS